MKRKINLKIMIPIMLIVIIIAVVTLLFHKKTTTLELTPELARTQEYDDVIAGDEKVYDDTGQEITAIQFDAFFLNDKDGDEVAESIRGTCNEIGSEANLYMDLKVIEEGKLKNATITINSDNFYFNTSIVKNNEISTNYISSNTEKIELNEMSNGSQIFLSGGVRSGDYSSTSGRTSAIGNDTNNYSKVNSITFSGVFEDNDGNERSFSKKIPITVDWYGEVNSEITPQAQVIEQTELDDLITENELTLNFDITTTENNNQLIMAGSYISGTIPELNGYKPTSVKISGTNVTYTYDEETGAFTAQREAILDENGKVTTNAYTSNSGGTAKNVFKFNITYPVDAYLALGEDITSFEIAIPVEAINKGYNNPHTEDGFQNPYISNTATGIVVTTWRKKVEPSATYSPSFNIYVGSYQGSPYNNYVISKEKPLNLYTGKSIEETDDTYIVEWRAYTGTGGTTDGIIMQESEGKTDNFLNTSSDSISMEEITSNKGIYFSGATETLGTSGWIRVYDADTDALIATFTSSNWSKYTSSTPYLYENKIKHIRIETSGTNELSYLYVYNIKELDDEYITENFTREEFNNLSFIYSYLDGYMKNVAEDTEEVTYWYEAHEKSNRALYEAPTSIATISIKENTISTQATAENEKITITTDTSGYNQQGWKNGIFLVKLPTDIISAEINEVTIDNEYVTITAYDVYEENDNYYIQILTENTEETSYSITIDCNLTPDPRIARKTETVELYAVNENAYKYYYASSDTYDVDGDLNVTEQINYRTTSLTLEPGSSLNTTQLTRNYDVVNNVTIAPRVAKVDKNQRTATISITAINNYTNDVTDIKMQGVVPFEGNTYVISGMDMGSMFTTHMSDAGISTPIEGLKDHITVYYSTNERPTNDENLDSNEWKLSQDVEDWSQIKTYLIIIDNSYSLSTGESIEFEYEISIPEGINYNEVTYSEHAIYFAIDADEGLYYTSTGCDKLGFMIAKQYDLEIIKYQENTEKAIQGVTFTITEEGQDTSTIKVTNANGMTTFSGLYAERNYILKEVKTTDDYVLNEEEIHFYTYTEINPDGTESLYLVYKNDGENESYSKLSDIYTWIAGETVIPPDAENEQDYKIQLKLENEPKAKLKINKVDKSTNQAIKNVKFTLTGKGKNGEILTTDTDGNINVSGLYLEEEYTLQEEKATGYYIPQTPITFKITNDNGTFELIYTDNGTVKTQEITTNDEIPTINLNLQNEKIPTYGLQLTKYAKGETEEKDDEQVDKVLEGAQYKIYGDGISSEGKIYRTDENGILTIDGLYEYVEGKYITGEYTLTEIYAPEGYSLNGTSLKFKAYRDNGTLDIEILEGEDVIRLITNETEESQTDLNIENASETYPVIQIGVEDSQIFSIYKYETDGTVSTKTPIAGTKFVITDLEGNNVVGTDGKTIGEWDDTFQNYVVTTDENGQINANLPEGTYKVVEIYTDEKYILDENEENRTYYFRIGASQAETWDWYNGITGAGWEYINSIASTNDGGVVGVGSILNYSTDIVSGTQEGTDVNNDGIIDETAQGSNDGIIVAYDYEGNNLWSKTFGGEKNDALNKIIQTSDGGYVVVGYVTSSTVKYDGIEIASLSKSGKELAGKDAVILKLDEIGNYLWGVRFGGTLDDEITSVTETSENNLAIVGKYYSSTFNFYDAGDSNSIVDSFENLGGMDGFVASYSESGKYQWSQRIAGSYDDEAIDVTVTTSGIAVAMNYIYRVYLNTEGSVSQYGGGYSGTVALVIGYSFDGTYSWRYGFSGSSSDNVEISTIDVKRNGNICMAIEYTYYLHGSKNGGSKTTLISTTTNAFSYNAAIIELTSDGDYNGLIYILSGNYDDYIADITETSDGGILLGGWYYSDSGIDVDGDGSTAGTYDLPELSGEYTSDGFVIKLDSTGAVVYASRLYGDGYDLVTSVAETTDGSLVSGGSFNSSTLNATNFTKEQTDSDEETSEEESLISRVGKSEGFILAEGAVAAEVPEAQSLEIENKVKTFKITTEVRKHTEGTTEVAGGTIDGQTGFTIDGVEYTEDGIRYVETVSYGEDSKQEIKITPEDGYVVASITINDIEYTNFTTDDNGIVTLPIFEDVLEDKHIIVEFSNTKGALEVNHYLWTETEGTTATKVADSESYTGDIGDNYTTSPNTDIDYEIITNADFYGENLPSDLVGTDYYIPEKSTGTYGTEKTVVNYYYKEKTYTLTVHHYIAGTNEQVPRKGSTTGETVPDELTEGYKKGDPYTTTQASEDLIDYDIYELVATPEYASGTIEENTVATYYYDIKKASMSITKVAEENHDITLGGTKFALYKLVGEEPQTDELIDTENVGDNWQQVRTYTTPDSGILRLEDLPINAEYRLVETKATDGRMKADGQWKIEFVYGDYDETDTSITNVNGTLIKITAIGNPPALAISEEGKLLLPNREYYQIPTSGGIGIGTIYQAGLIIVMLGLAIFVGRKIILINSKTSKGKHNRKKGKKT